MSDLKVQSLELTKDKAKEQIKDYLKECTDINTLESTYSGLRKKLTDIKMQDINTTKKNAKKIIKEKYKKELKKAKKVNRDKELIESITYETVKVIVGHYIELQEFLETEYNCQKQNILKLE